jgi:hypothetical protein
VDFAYVGVGRSHVTLSRDAFQFISILHPLTLTGPTLSFMYHSFHLNLFHHYLTARTSLGHPDAQNEPHSELGMTLFLLLSQLHAVAAFSVLIGRLGTKFQVDGASSRPKLL